MNSVEYSLVVQRISVILSGLSFLYISSLLAFINPEYSVYAVFAMLLGLFIFCWCLGVLLGFWWFSNLQKKLLTIAQVNTLVLRAGVWAISMFYLTLTMVTSGLSWIQVLLFFGGITLANFWLKI